MLHRVLGLWLALAVSANGAELAFDFGTTPTETPPPGFTNVVAGRGDPGIWRVVLDELPSAFAPLTDQAPVVTRRGVLAQLSMEVADERFPMLIYEKETFGDFTLTTRFKLVEGVVEQMAGVVFRYQDEKNFYVIRASGLGNNLRFYKVVAGLRSPPIGPSVSVPRRSWHELKIECQGNKIRAWLNGEQILPELTDTSFRSGKIGYWTKSDSVSYFADTRITYTPRETLGQVLVRDTVEKYPRLVGLKLYLLDEAGVPRVVASKDATEVGAAGGESETGCIKDGAVFYGKGKETVTVVQPLRDRNGDPMAAVRVTMQSFPGQTQQNALQRALPIVREMQKRVRARDELQP